MAASPFSDYQSFYEASGPIYTFADRPAIIALLLVAGVAIFLYFIYSTFTMNKGSSEGSNPVILGILLATTAFSAAEAIYQNLSGKEANQQAAVTHNAGPQRSAGPLALLGMVGLGAAGSRRRDGYRRLKRLSRRDRL